LLPGPHRMAIGPFSGNIFRAVCATACPAASISSNPSMPDFIVMLSALAISAGVNNSNIRASYKQSTFGPPDILMQERTNYPLNDAFLGIFWQVKQAELKRLCKLSHSRHPKRSMDLPTHSFQTELSA